MIFVVAACGGGVGETPASGTGPGGQGDPRNGSSSSADEQGARDEQPSLSDPCSLLHPGSAKALPNGLVAPNAPALRLTFTLANQRIEVTAIAAEQTVPTWTSENTQIFSPDRTSGFWVETRDTAGTLLYQQNLHDPLGRKVEVPPDPDNAEGWSHSEQCTSTASFRVNVPGGAAEVRLYGRERSDSPTVLLAWYRLP